MKNHLLVVLLAIVFSTATSASAECPSDDAFFCSQYELAEQGDARAQTNLGAMYWNGEGLISDQREAYIWFSIAKANGSEGAADNLRELNWTLDVAEIKSARLEAARRLQAIRQQD